MAKNKQDKTEQASQNSEVKNNNNQNTKSFKLPDWTLILIFAIATAVFFWNNISGDAFFWDDFVEQVYPTQSYSAQMASEGKIPFWNPYQFAGMPFYADLQVGFYYPFNRFLTFFVDDSGQLSPVALQNMIILHYLVAMIAMFYLVRSYGVSKLGSAIGAMSYGLSFALVLHAFHPMIVYQLAWFPLVVMFFRKGLLEGKLSSAALAGLTLGLSILAGHAQTMLYQFLFLGFMFVWYLIDIIRKKEQNVVKPVINAAIPVILAAGLFMVQYLPSSELAENSARQGYTLEEAADGSLQFKQLLTTLVPKLYGEVSQDRNNELQWHLEDSQYYYYWDTGFYFGIIPFLLALVIVISNNRKSDVALLIVLSLFSILYALGEIGLLFSIFHQLPFFDLLRIPSRMLFFFVLGFGVLAGMGFDRIAEIKKLSPGILLAIGIVVLFPLLTLAGVLPSMIGTPDQLQDVVSGTGLSALIYAIIGAVIIYTLTTKKLQPIPAFAILILVVFIDLYFAGSKFNEGEMDPRERYKLNAKTEDMLVPDGPDDLYRVSMRTYQPSFMAMARNQGVMSGIHLIEGYNQLQLNRIVPPLGDRDKIHNMFNVRYDISFNQQRQPYWNQRTESMPRAWVVGQYELHAPEEVKDIMMTSNLDYRKTVILEEKPSGNYSSEEINAEIEFISYEENNMELKIKSDKAGLLVFSEIYYPNWEAFVYDNETKVYRANYCLRAIEIPTGTSTVKMIYSSSEYGAGLAISLISLFTGLSIVIIGLIRRKK